MRNTKVKKRRKAKMRNPVSHEPHKVSWGKFLVSMAERIFGNEKATAEEIEKAQKQKNRGMAMIVGFVKPGGSKTKRRSGLNKHRSRMAAAQRRRRK